MTALNEEVLGSTYRRYLQTGMCDDRQLVILFMLVERARGEASPRAAYIAALPESFDTPLWYSDAELKELEGTPLAAAAAAQRHGVAATWKALAPLAAEALSVATGGRPPRALTEEDYRWAYSAFWSRALLFPDPAVIAAERASGQARADRLSATPLAEGIIPGLDFCNHSPKAGARWTIYGAKGRDKDAASPQSIILLETGPAHRRDEEVRISYGDKSNEELLFTYGFAVPGNPSDLALITPPLPPAVEMDDIMETRLQFLGELGMEPRAFLPLEALREGQGAAERALLGVPLPAFTDALPLFEVFSLRPKVVAELRSRGDGAEGAEMLRQALVKSRRSALLLMTRMLELRNADLDKAGKAADAAAAAAAAGEKRQQGRSQQRLEAIAAYRHGQKDIVEGYLAIAQRLLVLTAPPEGDDAASRKRDARAGSPTFVENEDV